ncbi:hypothetical protein BCR43DRAFT_265062 [Syncephalastrum racemosum]|uniref:Uncharacterized protein n=1 Tax=Syncephalastrum racemosum TaxID=13706 RepID=A0A1X2HH12_SYNRA|nr:hypothetical protein BCR43DRAFT_265062 [Syncephalastrum racemosum]
MIDIRNMLKSMVVALNFFLIAATPILANCNYLRNDLFPRIAHMLSLHQISADTTILAVALTTLYAYVVLGFVNDLVQVNHQNALAELEKYPDSLTAQRRVARSLSVCLFTERAQQEVRQLFPGKIM